MSIIFKPFLGIKIFYNTFTITFLNNKVTQKNTKNLIEVYGHSYSYDYRLVGISFNNIK